MEDVKKGVYVSLSDGDVDIKTNEILLLLATLHEDFLEASLYEGMTDGVFRGCHNFLILYLLLRK